MDKAAKEAAEGESDPCDRLPAYLAKRRNGLPASLSAMKQVHNATLRQKWKETWMESPRYEKYVDLYEDDHSFAAFRWATRGATRNQTSLLVQLHTGHAPLNKHLHRLSRADTDICGSCREHIESVAHYLLECRGYEDERDRMPANARECL